MTIHRVKTAIVGCGMISNIYIRNLMHLFSIIDLVAICDIVPGIAQQKASLYGVTKIMTLDEVAQSDEIELVVNLTSPVAHYEVIRKMLLAGKHVFTEKMLTTDLDQGRELLEIANEKNLYLGVAPDTILGAGLQTARKVLDAGFIGRPTSCLVRLNRNQALNSEVYKFLRNNGGALPYDAGIYYVAALLSLLGPVKRVVGFGAPAPEHEPQLLYCADASDAWKIPGNNILVGSLVFKSGVLGSLHFDGNSINETLSTVTVYGTEGILELGDPNRFDGFVKLIKPETGECLIPHTHGYNGLPTLPNPTSFEVGYGHRGVGVAEMAWAMRENRPNRCGKEYGFHCMEVLCGLDQSAQQGKAYPMESSFAMEPLQSGYYSSIPHGSKRGDAELSLIH